MKIAVHASHLCQEREDGNQSYMLNLFSNLAKIDPVNNYTFYYNKPQAKRVEAANFKHKVSAQPIMWTQRVFPFLLRQDKPDLLFMPIQMLPFLKPKKLKSVVTIHDVAFLFYPETFPKKDLFLHKLYVKRAIDKADHLIAISQATKNDLVKIYGLDEKKISVIYHGVNRQRFHLMSKSEAHLIGEVKLKYGISKPYLLYIGNVQPRKNIQGLIAAYQALRQKTSYDLQLVIAGARAWLVEEVVKAIRQDYAEDIIFTGRFADKELPALLWGAEAFVLPSFYEGFGLPILEAMACGTPTLVANTPSLVEVAGGASLVFNPHSIDDMVKVLQNILKDPDLRKDLIAKGLERVEYFSWQKCAQETLQIFSQLEKL